LGATGGRAGKRGVQIAIADDVEDYLEFYDLQAETIRRVGHDVKFRRQMIVEGGKLLAEARLGTLWMARVGGMLAAGLFALYTERNACWWLGAMTREREALRACPMHALFDSAFRHAISLGCGHFELGGVITEGLRGFKTRWGTATHGQSTLEWSFGRLAPAARRLRSMLRSHRGRGPSMDESFGTEAVSANATRTAGCLQQVSNAPRSVTCQR